MVIGNIFVDFYLYTCTKMKGVTVRIVMNNFFYNLA